MKKALFIFITAMLLLSVLGQGQAAQLPSAAAGSVTTSIFFDSTTERTTEITDGDQIGLILFADSVLEDNMRVRLDVINDATDKLTNILDATTTSDSYSKSLTLTQAVYNGPGSFTLISTVTAASGQTDSDTLSLQVIESIPTNNRPVITSTPITTVNENTAYSYQVTATDADNDPLIYSFVQSPSWLSISPTTGLVSGTAPEVNTDFDYAVTVQVSDGKETATQFYVLTVNDVAQPTENQAPIITSNPITQVDENAQYNYQVIATDADGDTLQYTYSLTAPLGSTLFWLSLDPDTGLFSGTAPDVDSDTPYTITLSVTDGQDTATQIFVITVKDTTQPPTNNIPVITSTPVTQIDENETYTYQVDATDADNDTLVFSLTQSPSWLSIDANTGLISGTAPSVDSDTDFDITISVSDGQDTATQTYVLTVEDTDSNNDDGGSGRRTRKGPIIVDEIDQENYFDQFNSVIPLDDENQESEQAESNNRTRNLLILFFVLVFILAILVLTALIRRYW